MSAPMHVTRDVVVDLLPAYLAGEASADTRALVDEFLRRDPELAERVRRAAADDPLGMAPAAAPSPDAELHAFGRARRRLDELRWLFGLGWFFTAVGLGVRLSFRDGRPVELRLLVAEHPRVFGPVLALGVACWVGYAVLRRRARW